MNATDKQIADQIKALDLPALRARYLELYGEESRGGAEYLRKKIAYAMMQAREQESDGDEVGEYAEAERLTEQAITAEADRDFEGAEGLYLRAATLSPPDVAGQLRERATRAADQGRKAAARIAEAAADRLARPQSPLVPRGIRPRKPDPVAPANETPAEHTTRTALQGMIKVAEGAETRGELEAAADAWGVVAEMDSDNAAQHIKRGHELRALARSRVKRTPEEEKRRAQPGHIIMRGRKLTVGEIEDLADADDAQAQLAKTYQAKDEPASDVEPEVEQASAPGTSVVHPTASASAPTIVGEKQEVVAAGKPRDPRLPPVGTHFEATLKGGDRVRVEFTAGAGVLVLACLERPEFIDKTFDTVSALARAYCGRNTNGYLWLGLKAPWVAPASSPPRTMKLSDALDELLDKEDEGPPVELLNKEIGNGALEREQAAWRAADTNGTGAAAVDAAHQVDTLHVARPRPLAPALEAANRVELEKRRAMASAAVDEMAAHRAYVGTATGSAAPQRRETILEEARAACRAVRGDGYAEIALTRAALKIHAQRTAELADELAEAMGEEVFGVARRG